MGDDICTLSGAVDGLVEQEIKEIQESTQDSNKTVLRKGKEQNGMFLTSEAAGNIHTPPSMKLLAAMVVILDWQKNHPKDKIIGEFISWILGNWLLMLDNKSLRRS